MQEIAGLLSCAIFQPLCRLSRTNVAHDSGRASGNICGRWLASTGEVTLEVEGQATQRSVLDALEARYPIAFGSDRDHATQVSQAVPAVLACREDFSHESPMPLFQLKLRLERSLFDYRSDCWRLSLILRNNLTVHSKYFQENVKSRRFFGAHSSFM